MSGRNLGRQLAVEQHSDSGGIRRNPADWTGIQVTELVNQLWRLAARLLMRRADWRDAEAWGLAALAHGDVSGPSVALASVNAATDDVDRLVADALEYAARKPPTPAQAAFVLVCDIASSVGAGSLSPRAAADTLSTLYGDFADLDEHLRPFVVWSDDYEESTADDLAIDKDVRAELCSLAAALESRMVEESGDR